MNFRIRKKWFVETYDVILRDDFTHEIIPKSFTFQYVVQVKGFLRWHTVKAFNKIRAAARFMKSLQKKLKDEV